MCAGAYAKTQKPAPGSDDENAFGKKAFGGDATMAAGRRFTLFFVALTLFASNYGNLFRPLVHGLVQPLRHRPPDVAIAHAHVGGARGPVETRKPMRARCECARVWAAA